MKAVGSAINLSNKPSDKEIEEIYSPMLSHALVLRIPPGANIVGSLRVTCEWVGYPEYAYFVRANALYEDGPA